jgi:hypothetical protein
MPEAEALAERYRRSAARLDLVELMRKWLASPNDAQEGLPDLLSQLPTGYAFDIRTEVEALCPDAARIKDTLTMAAGGPAFATMPIDYVCMKQYPQYFERHRPAIERLAQAQLHRVELSSAWSKENGLSLTWHWHRWSNSRYRCFYAVTADRWLESPDAGDPLRGEGCLSIDMEAYQRHCRRSGGVPVAAPNADEAFVTIWPVISLAWKDIIGDPLHIGPVPARQRAGWLASLVWGQ